MTLDDVASGDAGQCGDNEEKRQQSGVHRRAPSNPPGRSRSTMMKTRKMPSCPKRLAKEQAAETFDDADKHAAEQGSGHRAHATQHHNGKGNQDKAIADPGLTLKLGISKQAAMATQVVPRPNVTA